MQEHTLIANSGIQIITFPLRINTQEKFKMWYHEWYDTEMGNGDLILCTNFAQMTSAIIITNRNFIKVAI